MCLRQRNRERANECMVAEFAEVRSDQAVVPEYLALKEGRTLHLLPKGMRADLLFMQLVYCSSLLKTVQAFPPVDQHRRAAAHETANASHVACAITWEVLLMSILLLC